LLETFFVTDTLFWTGIQAHWLVAQISYAQPKPAKELTNPNTQADKKIKHENTTRYIKHLADSAIFIGSTFNKHNNGLTGKCPAFATTHIKNVISP